MIINQVKELVNLIASKDEATGYISDYDFNRFGSMAQSQKLEEDLSLSNNRGIFNTGSLSAFKKTSYVEVVNGTATKPEDYRYFETASYPSLTSKVGHIVYAPFDALGSSESDFRAFSELEPPSLDFPILISEGNELKISPNTINQIKLTYIVNPPNIIWGFNIVSNRKVYAETGGEVETVDFMFSEDDIVNLVYRILTLASVSFREADIVQFSSAQETKDLQV